MNLESSSAARTHSARRRALWVLAALLLLMGAAATLWIIVGNQRQPSNTPAPLPSAGESEQEATWTVPTTAPADVTWAKVDLPRLITWVPSSPTYGPANAAAGEWAGWSQTPMGAVMAASTIEDGFGLNNAEAKDYLSKSCITVTDYLDQALTSRPADGQPPVLTRRITGFQVDDYTVSTADVRIRAITSMPGAEDQERVTTYQLQWADGDWKMLLTPSIHPTIAETATDDFVPWGPG